MTTIYFHMHTVQQQSYTQLLRTVSHTLLLYGRPTNQSIAVKGNGHPHVASSPTL